MAALLVAFFHASPTCRLHASPLEAESRTLDDWLAEQDLMVYADRLKGLGITKLSHLQDADDEVQNALNMKMGEKKRFIRERTAVLEALGSTAPR